MARQVPDKNPIVDDKNELAEKQNAEAAKKRAALKSGKDPMDIFIDAKLEAEKKRIVISAKDYVKIDLSDKSKLACEAIMAEYQAPDFEKGRIVKWSSKLQIGVVLPRKK